MVKNSRKPILFGAGLLVGVAAGALGMMSLRGGDGPYASSPPPTARSMGAAPASTAFLTAVAGNCDMAPMLPAAGNGDGRESLQAKPAAASTSEVASLILAGKEAAAAGRQRDAEIDFLNACRNAAALQDGDGIPIADSMYQLGRHYANVGAFGAPRSQELFQRAERLYSASLEAYRARYGDGHEKTRFAQEGLKSVQQATGGKPPTAIAKLPPAAPTPAPQALPQAQAPAPAPMPAPATAAAPESVQPAPETRAMPAEVAKETPKETPKPATAQRRPATVVAKPAPVERRRAPPPVDSAAADSYESPRPEVPPPLRMRRPEPEFEAPPAASMDSGPSGEAPTAEGSAGPQ
jgi:hypothetical protein